MPLRMGEMMVVVRAQDFASRTLRRVSGELVGMSREQMVAARRAEVSFRKMSAVSRVALAESDARRLNYVRNGVEMMRSFEKQMATMDRLQIAQQSVMQAGRFKKGTTRAQIREWQDASVAVRKMGLEGVMASRRLADAQKNFDRIRQKKRPGKAELAWSSRELRNAERAMKSLGDTGAAQATRWATLNRHIGQFQARIDTMSPVLRRAATGQGTLSTAIHRSNEELRRAYFELDRATRAELAFNQAVAHLPLHRLDNIGHALSGVGRTMQLFGAVSTVALAVAGNAYANFNQQVTLAATQTRQAGESFVQTAVNAERLGRHILRLMTRFPASSQEMADAAYTIFSSIDVNFKNGIKLLTEFNKVAVAGGTDLATATNAAITVLENFDTRLTDTGRITKDTSALLNRMFAIIRYGRMNFAQLNQLLTNVVPAATGARQSFDAVSGAIAFLTRTLGMKAGPSLARFLEFIVNPDVQKGMRKAGLAITDATGRLRAFPEVVRRFAALRATDPNDLLRIISAFGRGTGRGREFTIQGRKALIQLIDGYVEYARVQRAVVGNNNEFAQSFAAMSRTLGVRWQVFLNQMKVLVLYIGEHAIPVFLEIGETIGKWIDKWKNLSESARRNIVHWGTVVAVMTLVLGVLLSVVGALTTLTAALIIVGPKLKWIITPLGTAAGLLRTLAGIGVITLGIQLLRKGEGWNLLGGLLTGGGLAMLLRRGGRGTIIGATIGIAATMVFKGGGWQSVVGQLLLGIAAGAAIGGIPGAFIGAAGIVIPLIIQQRMETQEFFADLNTLKRRQQDVARTLAAARNIPERQAALQLRNMIANAFREGGGGQAGVDAALKFLDDFTKTLVSKGKGPRDAFDGIAREAQKAFDATKPGTKTTTQSLEQLMKTAKAWTEIQEAVNLQTQATTDSTEALAIKIGMAFSRGNVSNAAKLLNAYVAASTQTITPANILKLIAEAVKSGDMRRATELLGEWVQKVQQGQEELKRYRQEMRDYQKQLADTSKQATTEIIDNLRNMYSQMEQENRQAFGELFQGPWLTSETFDLAQEWGITPRIQDMIRDLREQNQQFTHWRQSLDKVFKRGLPRGFVDELRKMGPEQGQPLLDNILKAKPGQINALIAEWKRREGRIQEATKMDFRDEIERFRKAGLSMGEAIIQGFQNAQTARWFDSWVKRTFPNVINAAVAQAVRDFKAATPVPIRPNVPTAVPGATRANPAGVAAGTGATTNNTNNSKKWEITVNVEHDEGAMQAYAYNRAAQRQVAFVTRNILRGLV